LDGPFNFFIVKRQVLRCQLPKCLDFVPADIGTFVLLKAVQEKSAITTIGGNNRSTAPTFSPARQANSLLQQVPAQIAVHKPLQHLRNRLAKHVVGQASLSHPAGKSSGSKDPFHC
jgi:hypothetical protein